MENISKTRHTAKNSVFTDLFGIPKYRYELFRTIHPEMTDVKEEDVKEITLKPVILNHSYNDLGLLVRDKLMIFVEAQSTWSVNILVRILFYLALTYQDHIEEHELNVYSSVKLDLPVPEFYVIYTGKNHRVEKEYISLKEDFFRDAPVYIDLKAKVICAENDGDIIGQYIIFCHILDEQIKLHGRTAKAVEETIRICRDKGVLKEYLVHREKEVVTMEITLFDQEFAEKMMLAEAKREAERAGMQQGVRQGVKNAVELCQEFGASFESTIARISAKFGFSSAESAEQVKTYWKGEIPTV